MCFKIERNLEFNILPLNGKNQTFLTVLQNNFYCFLSNSINRCSSRTGLFPKVSYIFSELFRVSESLTLGTIKIAKIRGARYFLTFNLAGTAYTTVILFLLQQQPQLEE